MGCDMVVALGQATAEGHTLFGLNSHRSARDCQALAWSPGRDHAFDEKVRTQFLEIPQARKTHAVLGSRPHGRWGYQHGINQHRLAAGCATLRTRLPCEGPGLLGTDLVRLLLERCQGARQAVDQLAGLLERYGQGLFPGSPEEVEGDTALLVADPREAFAVETAGNYWVYQEVRSLRAVSDVCVVRQDWDRIAPGLASRAINQGWWPGDGTKLDFAGAVSAASLGLASGLRRWGRSTLLLAEQQGHLDVACVRRLLADHYEGTRDEVDPAEISNGPVPLCRHAGPGAGTATAASFVAALGPDPQQVAPAWCAFGPPCQGVYVPVFLEGELPAALTRSAAAPERESLWWRVQQLGLKTAGSAEVRARAREQMERLQGTFDEEADGFAAEGAALKRRGDLAGLQRQAGLFMQHVLEQYEAALDQLEAAGARAPVEAARPR